MNVRIFKEIYSVSRKYIVLSCILPIASSFLPIITTLLLRASINIGNKYYGTRKFILFLTLYVVFYFLNTIIQSEFMSKIAPKEQKKIKKYFLMRIFKRTSKCDPLKFENTDFINKYSFILNNLEKYSIGVISTISNFFSLILTIIMLFMIIVSIDKFIFVFGFFISLLSYALNRKIIKINYDLSVSNTPLFVKESYISRIFFLNKYVKDLRQSKLFEKISRLYDKTYDFYKKNIDYYGNKLRNTVNARSLLELMYLIVSFLYLTRKLFLKIILPGDFVAIFNSCNQLSGAISGIINSIVELKQNEIYISEYYNFIDSIDTEKSAKKQCTEFKTLELKEVYFKYPNSKEYAIKNISMTIKSGEKIAIIGVNGSGKSTLINLFLGLYEPTKGEVLLNGENILNFSRESINAIMGALFQDFNIYSFSIKENVFLNSTSASLSDEKEMISILEMLHFNDNEPLDKFVNKKIGNEIYEDGIELSGGQMQKIALARVLLPKYQFIILDEPTSFQDLYSENAFFEHIYNFVKEKTIVIISHKLANIQNVNKIYFLNQGNCVDTGTHEELMQTNKTYRELFEMQKKIS